jgi:acetyltransferase-like isoleucine patch superfamily enzyme
MVITDWLYFKKNTLVQKYRAIKKFYFFRTLNIQLGHNVFLRRGKGKHRFGAKNIVLDNCIFEVHNHNASIITGNDCMFAFGVLVVCCNKIEMGNHVWIGEYTSLRDATHIFSGEHELGTIPDKVKPIKIGNNVWIGRGCLIMPGTVIEDNVVIAANSVVKGLYTSGGIYGGAPAKFIKQVYA